MIPRIAALIALAVLLAHGSAAAQPVTLQVGGLGTQGCQATGNPPPLTGGALGSANVTFDWDGAASTLTLTVDNTSPIVAGEHTALITKVFFNLPSSVTGATLVSQSQGSGATAPAFGLTLGAIGANCFGYADAVLGNGGGIAGGIAHPSAPLISGPAGSAVLGPATFVLAISTVAPLTTADFTSEATVGGDEAVVAMKFQGAGVGGVQSGVLGSAPPCVGVAAFVTPLSPACSLPQDPVMSTDGLPIAGGSVRLNVDGPSFPNSVVLLFASYGPPVPTPIPLPSTTCIIYVDLNTFFLLHSGQTDANGHYEKTFVFSGSPSLIGLEATLQARICDPTQPGPIPGFPDWFSTALHIGIGCP